MYLGLKGLISCPTFNIVGVERQNDPSLFVPTGTAVMRSLRGEIPSFLNSTYGSFVPGSTGLHFCLPGSFSFGLRQNSYKNVTLALLANEITRNAGLIRARPAFSLVSVRLRPFRS